LGTVIQTTENKSIVFLISAVSLAISAFLWVFVSDKSHLQNANSKK